MAITRTRSTLIPAALATVRFCPTARNCCPMRVFMIALLNTHNSATIRNVTIGTLTMENAAVTNGSCAMTATATQMPVRVRAFFLSSFFVASFTRLHMAISPQRISAAVPKGTRHRPSSAYLKPRSVERSMVFATPVEPLMTRPGVFNGIRFPKMNRNNN